MFRNISGTSLDTQTWLAGGEDFLLRMYNAEELVVNPLFCFVSGVVSQGAPTPRRLQRFAQYLVLPALMFVMVVRPFFWQFIISLDPSTLPDGFSKMVDQLSHLDTVTIPWYLEALIVWRASVYLLWAQMHPSVSFVGMVALSCIAGYSTELNLDHWGSGLGSATGYLPYFALGYIFPFGKVTKLVEKPRTPVSVAVAVGIFCWAFWIVPSMFSEHALPDGHGTYDCCRSSEVFNSLPELDRSLYWVRRLGRMTIDVVPMLLLVFIVLPRNETPFTYMGSHTLYSYLFHSAAHHWRDTLTQAISIPVIHSPVVHVFVLLLHVPYCLGVLTLLTSSYFRNLFRWALTPDWASVFFEQPTSK
jgi:fucose 4-O-acetylase-like acetyltransferase